MIFGGRFKESAREGHAFAISEGFGGFGPAVYGEFCSYGEHPWAHQATIAKDVGCTLRTVQRWSARFRAEGLMTSRMGGPKEIPPNHDAPLRSRWAYRTMTVWPSKHTAKTFHQARAELIAKREERARERREAPARFKGWSARQITEEMLRRQGKSRAEIDDELLRVHGPPAPD